MAKRGRPKKDQGWGTSTQTEVGESSTASVQVIAPEAPASDPIVLPGAAEALTLLAQLADQNDRVTLARKRYEESAATTKVRKGTLEMESAELSRMLTEGTHQKPLPLFDTDQAERDLKALEDAVAGAVAEPAGETSGDGATVDSVVLPFVAPAASEAIAPADVGPF